MESHHSLFMPLHTPGTILYTTTETFQELVSYNEILWWPVANRIMVRQKDSEYWEMWGYDQYFATNATVATLAAVNIENKASGRIVLGGTLPLRPVFSN